MNPLLAYLLGLATLPVLALIGRTLGVFSMGARTETTAEAEVREKREREEDKDS